MTKGYRLYFPSFSEGGMGWGLSQFSYKFFSKFRTFPQGKDGKTALFWAVEKDHVAIVKVRNL